MEFHVSPREALAPVTEAVEATQENLEAERSILCAMLFSAEAVREARGLLQPRHFHRESHRKLFAAMLDMGQAEKPVDLVTLTAEMTRRGDLEAVGGSYAIAVLAELSVSAANLKYYAKLVRERHVRRTARAAGRKLIEAAENPIAPIEEAIDSHRKTVREIVDDHAAADRHAWMGDIMTLEQVMKTEFPPIESIVGRGFLTRGSYGLMAGHSNLGKTYLTIQMVADIVAGRDFMGQPTKPVRVGMLEFEMPYQSMKARAMNLHSFQEVASTIDMLCMPRGRWYLTERPTIERMVDWCGERKLGLLVVDPINRVRPGDASDPELAAELLDAVHEITQRTGTTLLFVSHVRKVPSQGRSGPRTTSSSLDAIKGDSRYVDDADSVFFIDEVIDGTERLIRLEWAKARFGEKPADCFLKRGKGGFFDVVESPTAKRDATEDQLLGILQRVWTDGARCDDVATELGVNELRARRLLKRVGAVSLGGRKQAKWYSTDAAKNLEARQGDLSVETDNPSESTNDESPW